MARTDFLRFTTGYNLYARPLVSGAWTDTGHVNGSDSNEAGKYEFPNLVDGITYEVFIRAGEDPAEGDVAVGELPAYPAQIANVPQYGDTQEFNDGDVGQSETHRVVVTKV